MRDRTPTSVSKDFHRVVRKTRFRRLYSTHRAVSCQWCGDRRLSQTQHLHTDLRQEPSVCSHRCAYKGSTRKPVPVLFYIHGGGYTFGNPANWPFEHWVNQSPNVVIVSIYYRLASFGFLATPEFHDHSHGDFNAGFLDQVEALRWVRRHIASFGGDPNRVTISGHSAGGGSVELHLVADHQREGLFSGAIGQSMFRGAMRTSEELAVGHPPS